MTDDCSTNRFATLQENKEEKNPFLFKITHARINELDGPFPRGSRWTQLESSENTKINTFKDGNRGRINDNDNYNDNNDNSDSNSFRKRRNDRGYERGNERGNDRGYGRGNDRGYERGNDRGYERGNERGRYNNNYRSAFRRETRPKTPPPKTFKLADDDFPALG